MPVSTTPMSGFALSGPSRSLFAVLLLALLASCAGTRTGWPSEAPEQHVFVSAYQQDELNQQFQTQSEYIAWVRNFYTGTVVYPTGWLEIQSQLLDGIHPEVRTDVHAELHELGAAIGVEWAKDNSRRLIDNRMLALWGSILQLADAEGKRSESIALIARDVDGLYQASVTKQDIVEARYTELLGLESFGGF